MVSIDELLGDLKRKNYTLYNTLGTMCKQAFINAGEEYRNKRSYPKPGDYPRGAMYSVAINSYYRDLNDVQCDAFYRVLHKSVIEDLSARGIDTSNNLFKKS